MAEDRRPAHERGRLRLKEHLPGLVLVLLLGLLVLLGLTLALMALPLVVLAFPLTITAVLIVLAVAWLRHRRPR